MGARECIDLAQDKDRYTVMKLLVPYNAGNFLVA
jgi:hypothetical protein